MSFNPDECGLIDKCPGNPLCAFGCDHYAHCYPNTWSAMDIRNHIPDGVISDDETLTKLAKVDIANPLDRDDDLAKGKELKDES